jgi:hypothetical protein
VVAVEYAYTFVRCPVVTTIYNQAYYRLRLTRRTIEPQHIPCRHGIWGTHVGQKSPPDLVDALKALRERHGMSIGDIERCLKLATDTYRHIERRRRPLPDFQHRLIPWLRTFLRCVGATRDEEQEVMEYASKALLEQFSEWMDDLRSR